MIIACAHCGKKTKLSDEFAGRQLKCPDCQTTFTATRAPEEERPEVQLPFHHSPVYQISAYSIRYGCKLVGIPAPEGRALTNIVLTILVFWFFALLASGALAGYLTEVWRVGKETTYAICLPTFGLLTLLAFTASFYWGLGPMRVTDALKLGGVYLVGFVLLLGVPIALLIALFFVARGFLHPNQ